MQVKSLYSVYLCFFVRRFNVSGCQKTVSETNYYLSTMYNRTSNVFVDVNVDTECNNFNIPLIFGKVYITL